MDLDKLEALAQAATPGPWYVSSEAVWQGTKDTYNKDLHIICDTGDAPTETLEFIAAANPQTVLQLIAALREAGRVLAAYGAGDEALLDLMGGET